MNSFHTTPFTRVESLSLSENFTYRMATWNHSINSKLKPMAAKVLGFASAAFIALADFLIHTSLATCKSIIALSILPFKWCFPIPRDLKFSSSLIHLIYAVRSLFNVAILPFVCLLNPDRAYRVCQHHHYEKTKRKALEQMQVKEKTDQIEAGITSKERTIKNQRDKIEELNHDIEKTEQNLKKENQTQNEKIKILQNEKNELKEEIRQIKNQLTEVNRVPQVNDVIENLQQEVQEFYTHLTYVQEKVSEVSAELDELDREEERLESEKNRLNHQKMELEEALQQLQKEHQQLQQA